MRSDSLNWLESLNDVLEYIEDNLEGEISLDSCADIMCTSSFYFQRIFSYITGISLSEYIRRRKMTQAGFILKNSDEKIIDLAFRFGYSSPSSFTRAFKSIHGITPSKARKIESTLNSYPKIEFKVDILNGKSMKYKIKELDEFKIIGKSIKLTDEMDKNQIIASNFWKEMLKPNNFNKILSLNPNANNIYGVTEVKSSDEIYYYIGVKQTSKSISFKKIDTCIIPKSRWVIFENEKDIKTDVQNTFKRFYSEWLIFSGYSYGFLPDVEIYPLSDNSNVKNSKVLISIKKENENEL